MEEKRSPGSVDRHEDPEQSHPKGRVEDEFREFEALISSDENVEYEENDPLEVLKGKDRLKERDPVESRGVRVVQTGDGADQHVEIPLQIELPGGVTEDVLLNIVISLQKVRKQKDFYSGSGPEDSFPDDDSEIDILDGRTTLIFDEDDEAEEEEKDSSKEESDEGWINKIFSFWKR
jgi:hypothetical protein